MEDKKNWKNFNFSYSSATTFDHCRYAFKLTYIDQVYRENNFFSDYGSFMHSVLEKYFDGTLEIYELLDYYRLEYYNHVKNSPPGFMRNVPTNYYEAGEKFFENIEFDRDDYEIIFAEDYVKGTDQGVGIVIKPDLILKDKNNGEIFILDFKTSEIEKNGRIDEEKLNGYKKQINLYIYYIWLFKNIEITKAKLWFLRSDTWYEWDYDPYDATESKIWFIEIARQAMEETEWEANPSNPFFCNVLCGVAHLCEFKKPMGR